MFHRTAFCCRLWRRKDTTIRLPDFHTKSKDNVDNLELGFKLETTNFNQDGLNLGYVFSWFSMFGFFYSGNSF